MDGVSEPEDLAGDRPDSEARDHERDAESATDEGSAAVLQSRLATLKASLQAQLSEIGVLDNMTDEDRAKAEEEQTKLSAMLTRLETWGGGILHKSALDEDEALREQAKEIASDAQDLLGSLAERPGAKELVDRAKAIFSERMNDHAGNTALLNKLKAKLGDNRDAVADVLKRAPALMERLNTAATAANAGREDGKPLTVAEMLDVLNSKGGGMVKIKDGVVGTDDTSLDNVNGGSLHGDETIDDILVTKLAPMLKERAGDLGRKLKDFKTGGQSESLLEKGLTLLDEHNVVSRVSSQLDGSMSADEMIDWGERMVRDADARAKLIDQVKDSVLDFLISYLPNVPIPPIEGDKEGLLYKIENIDMGGFKVRKENVDVELNGFDKIMKGVPFFTVRVKNVTAVLDGIKWSVMQNYFPRLSAGGVANALLRDGAVELSLQLIKSPYGEDDGDDDKKVADSDAATSPLQSGAASKPDDQEAVGNSVSQQALWKPQLLLASCEVSIGSIDVEVKESQFAWLYNTMSELFSDSLRLYIVSLLQDTLMEHIAGLSETLNTFVAGNWPMVASFLDIDIDQLPEVGVAEEYVNRQRLEKLRRSKRKDVYTVTFAERGQLGLVFGQRHEFVVVKTFRRAQDNSMLPAERNGEVKIGDVLVAFNGQQITSLPLGRVMERLRRARRPLHLTFMVPLASATQRPGTSGQTETQRKPGAKSPLAQAAVGARSPVLDVEFPEKRLYLVLASRWENELDRCDPSGFSGVVKGFSKKEDGSPGPAESGGAVRPGMVLVAANGTNLVGMGFNKVHQVIRSMPERPLKLRFSNDPEYVIKFDSTDQAGGLGQDTLPVDMHVSCLPGGIIVVTSVAPVLGPGERQCPDLVQGDALQSINGQPVEAGQFNATIAKLKSAPRPLQLAFSRPPSAQTFCQATFQEGPIGLIFYRSQENNVLFKAFSHFAGPAKRAGVQVGHVLLEINGVALGGDIEPGQVHEMLQKGPKVELRMRNMSIHEAAIEGLKG